MPRMQSAFSQNQRGIALMLVLWILVLLTMIALALTGSQRVETRLAVNRLDQARFRARAEAAVQYALFQLSASAATQEEDEEAWLPDGQAHAWRFDETDLRIRIFNETSLINLNLASRNLLSNLFHALDLEGEESDALVDAILDWRDENDLHLTQGAEDPEYEAEGYPYGAKDGPFDSTEELLQVMGFDRDLYEQIAPALTVASGRATVIQEFAPTLVRAALAGITLEEMEAREDGEEWDAGQPSKNIGGPLYRIQVVSGDGPVEKSLTALVYQKAGKSKAVVYWRRYGTGRRVTASESDGKME